VDTWDVVAIRYGTLTSTKTGLYHRWSAYDEPDGPQVLDYHFWVLRSEATTILVDTGFDPQVAQRRGRQTLTAPLVALERLGVAPDLVVLTHLHYDHTGNVAAFGDLQLRVPEREAAFWRTPSSRHVLFAEHAEAADLEHVLGRLDDGSADTFGGGTTLAPGVVAVDLPGHTPGQVGLLVTTLGGPVLLASDAVHLYAELDQHRPFAIFVDLEAMLASYEVIEAAVDDGAEMVPGHDPDVAHRYPAVPGMDGLAFRIVSRRSPSLL
jgi:glyoxylase-like metal-dependent hydrolase (beta-lactamase superfamily II)